MPKSSLFLQHLLLRNFRNYEEAELFFSPSVNIIHGHNGQGKTNLLEAIYLLSTGRSFRTHRLNELIRFGASYFYLEASFLKEGVSQTLKVFYNTKTRKVQYNQTTYPQFSSLLGILPQVLLAPEDHGLINGTPAERRRFLDLHIAQFSPVYLHHLGRYCRAVKQRNYLLRHKHTPSIEAWEQTMAPSAAHLTQHRQGTIKNLIPYLQKWIAALSENRETLDIIYTTPGAFQHKLQDNLTDTFLNCWKQHRSKEMQAGATLYGPHRDDLLIQLSEQEAKGFASEGQKRCIATAFRFAAWEHFYELMEMPPLLSIDDFGIQLDELRAPRLHRQLPQFGQVFLTTPIPIIQDLSPSAHQQLIHVESGHLQIGLP